MDSQEKHGAFYALVQKW